MIKKIFSFLILYLYAQFNAQSVGQTSGNFSVSLTGGANYSVSIKALPGIKDIAPNISLSYSSQAGNGIAGWGWNIDGLSSITRISSSKSIDGSIDPVDFDDKDRFVLDGQKLILKSGTYGGDAEYQLENYSNIKIISTAGSWAYTPSYFLVYYPNGTVAKYLFDGANKFEWKIDNTEDVNHNVIKFNYSVNLINSIEYGGNTSAGTPNVNKINFYYKNASRTENSMLYGGQSQNASKKLDRIEVISGTQLFRKYQLSYNTTSLNYDRLIQVQEYNGNNETIKPINFEYDTTDNGITNNSKTISGVSPAYDNTSWNYVSGYFDKDGSLDFMTYPSSKDKLYRFNSSQLTNSTSNVVGGLINVEKFSDVFTTKLLLPNNKFYPLDAISTITTNSGTVTNEEIIKVNNYISNSTYNSLDLSFNNSYTFPTVENQRCLTINGSNTYYSKIPKKYITGDFDGDGISDVLAITLPYSIETTYYCGGGLDPIGTTGKLPPSGCCTQSNTINGSNIYLLKLDPNNTSVQQPLQLGWSSVINSSSKIYVADFDGDGKSDIYVINGGKIYVYSVENNALVKIHETTDSSINSYVNTDYPFYVADFNGDGKTDIVIPTGDANSNWYFLIANGQTFTGGLKDIGKKYYKPKVVNQCYPLGTNNWLCGYMLEQVFFTFADLNGDGKADLFYHDILTPYNYPNGGQWNYPYTTYGDNYTIREFGGVKYNIGSEIFGSPNFSADIDTWQNNYTYGGATNKGTPIFLSNSSIANQNLDYAFFGGDKIKYISFKKDNRVDVTLKRVKENDVVTNITYSPLIDNGNGIYTPDESESYPFVNVNVSPSTQIVSRITRSFNTETKIQDYRYKGAVTNLDGLGFLGFKGVATSSINDGSTNQTVLWTISKQNPQKRGANVETYLLKDNFDFNSPTNFITKSIKQYNTNLLANKVFVNLPSQVQQIDNLTGVTRTIYYDLYDGFNNVTKSREVALGGEKTTLFEFDNNPTGINNQYFIGRPTKKTDLQTLGNESFSTEQSFIYTNNRVSQLKKKGNGTSYITEDYLYDNFGNTIQKTLSAVGTVPRVEKTQYDTSGRFVIKSTNILGFSDTYNYDTILGLLLSKTNYLNQTISYEYDSWQRKIKEKDFYNNYTLYSYDWITSGDFINGVRLKVVDPTGFTKETHNDVWGRKRLERELSINNKWIDIRTEYDIQDRPYKISDKYFSTNSPTRWAITEYDQYNRIKKITFPTGKITTSSYNALSTTVNNGTKTQTVTLDAWNNKIKMVDDGGSIDYSYFANGNLKSSNYGGHIINIEQDEWGRKTKLSDPSVGGDYLYSYDIWGQLLKEENPKGKTTYQYDQYGRVLTKTIVGDNTNTSVNYSYDNNGLLVSEIGSSNGIQNSYTYNYDNYYRLSSRVEDNGEMVVTKSYTFDGFGRTKNERTDVNQNSLLSSVNIENKYDSTCGILTQILDTATQSIIWQLNSVNEKGQILSASLGNGTNITNTYDTNYFLQSFIHNNSNGQVLSNEYSFDPVKGTLNYRKDNTIVAGGWQENFGYDNMDRLVSWSDPIGAQSQSYDTYGRIDNNSSVGDYKYDASNRYRKKGINLNPIGNAYYSVNSLQQINYNAYKAPVGISEQGINKVYFNYNIHQSRSSSQYDYNSITNLFKSYKIYSDDNSVEIFIKTPAGKPSASFVRTRIVTYIAGNPYSAPAVYIKDFNGAGTVLKEGYHYLHRDYQGTILAITDQAGKVEEQRHFDAWGNIIKLKKDGNDVAVNASLLLERGYTGHEHFMQVNLIHMNGRMYDPKLHTFLSVDNHIQDPFNSQNYNRFGYVLNNPLLYTDPSGEFLFVPILIGMAYGALVGAAIAVVTYSIPALMNGSWNWKGLGTSILYGAITGAISGGISAGAAQMGGAFWQSATMNMLTSVASQVGTSAAMGDHITWGMLAAGVVSGYLGSKMDNWTGTSGGWLANASEELVYNAGKGAILGGVSGTLAAALNGKDMGEGMKNGMINGAYGGASQTAAKIAFLGATFTPKESQLEKVKQMSKDYNVAYNNIAWRNGGLLNLLLPNTAITIGNNVTMGSKDFSASLFGHEFGHILQQYYGQENYGNGYNSKPQGWAYYQAMGMWEQWILSSIFGVDVYHKWSPVGKQYNEFDANFKNRNFNGE